MSAPDPDTVTIACPQCSTRYALPAGAIGAGGRKVSCTQCGSAWVARPVLAEQFSTTPDPTPPTDMVPRQRNAPDGVTPLSEADEDGLDSRFGDLDIKVKAPRKRQLGGIDLHSIGIDNAYDSGRAGRYVRARTAAHLQGPGERILGVLRALSFALLALVIGSALLFRTELVRAAPDLAALYRLFGAEVNVMGLSITELRTSTIKRGATPVLTVDATLTNITGDSVYLPDVIINVVNDKGESLYGWSVIPPVPNLAPGEQVRIGSELSNPPVGGTRIVMNFAGTPLPTDLASPRDKHAEPPSFTVDQPTPLDTNNALELIPKLDSAETDH